MERIENTYQGKKIEQPNPTKIKKLSEGKYYEVIVQGKEKIPYPEIATFITLAISEFEGDLINNIKYPNEKCNEIALINDKQLKVTERLNDINQNAAEKSKAFIAKLEKKYKGKNKVIPSFGLHFR